MSENKNEFETIDFADENSADKKEILKWDVRKNIFNDFDSDASLQVELKNIKEKESKDMFYFLSKFLIVLEIIVVLAFLFSIWGFLYTYIQKDSEFSNKEFLNPICSIFNGDLVDEWAWCSSISYNKRIIDSRLKELNKEQAKLVLNILPMIYEKENFLKTKEIAFLNDKSQNKLKVLDIIAKFDQVKNEFTWVEKKKLQCNNLTISAKDRTLSMKCEAYANGYTSWIIWPSWNKNSESDSLSGTSISIANSFINYIEKNYTKYFSVIDRQKTFDVEPIVWSWAYTKKTPFDLKLKINF